MKVCPTGTLVWCKVTPVLVLTGDANRDRIVNLADFLILRANFNAAVPAPGLSGFLIAPGSGLFGGSEDDRLIALAGTDELYGDDGDDYLSGGQGADL
ncbi:MAG: hypothetical protein AAGK78_05375, partial [Planctomycetota bacterium]